MKRWLLFALICSVGCLGLSSPAQASANGPAAVLEEHCYMDSPDTAVYGVKAGVSGFPPNVDFTASLDQSLGGGVGPGTFTTSSNGDFFGYLGLFVPATWTLTVDSPYLGGTVTKTLTVTCPNGFADFPGNVSGAVVTGPQADVRRVIWPKTVAGLLSKGVRVRVGCDKSCRVTTKVSLRNGVPGISKGAVIAHHGAHRDAGQVGWITANVIESARRALLGGAAGMDLAPLLRVNASIH